MSSTALARLVPFDPSSYSSVGSGDGEDVAGLISGTDRGIVCVDSGTGENVVAIAADCRGAG